MVKFDYGIPGESNLVGGVWYLVQKVDLILERYLKHFPENQDCSARELISLLSQLQSFLQWLQSGDFFQFQVPVKYVTEIE